MPNVVRVQGLSRLERTLRKLPYEIADLKAENTALAAAAAGVVRRFVRSRSGRLAGTVRGTKAKSKIAVLAGRKSTPYAGPINWGWRSRPNAARGWRGGPITGQRFMQDGGNAAQGMVVRGWTAAMQDRLDKVKGV